MWPYNQEDVIETKPMEPPRTPRAPMWNLRTKPSRTSLRALRSLW